MSWTDAVLVYERDGNQDDRYEDRADGFPHLRHLP
jgi:hypothetical protein